MNTYHWDYIPRKDAELVAWSANFVGKVAANAVAWEIPPGEVDFLRTAAGAFAALHARVDSPARTSVLVAEKNAARKVLETAIRRLAGWRLKNPAITNVDRVALGLRVRDAVPSTNPVPASRPEIEIEVVDVRRLRVLFRDMGSAGRAKPRGVTGALIAYALCGTPPTGTGALTRCVLATRTPYGLEFAEEERGRTVYFAARWQNRKGLCGPWSKIESAIVP
ncbi:MAG: hypothetical protein LBH72_00825 [Proteiniphilum sp.]|jgi:hypothetical protein|nr:hypothetical protein [Proteiniphilum sp.]